MVNKPKFYKIALVATAIVLMLVSTAGAFPFCPTLYLLRDYQPIRSPQEVEILEFKNMGLNP